MPGLGVRCVGDQPWVTGAETCELVMALDACGDAGAGAGMFAEHAAPARTPDGSYWTGWQFANQAPFPRERSTWTSAAVVLAADALAGFTGGAGDLPRRGASDADPGAGRSPTGRSASRRSEPSPSTSVNAPDSSARW